MFFEVGTKMNSPWEIDLGGIHMFVTQGHLALANHRESGSQSLTLRCAKWCTVPASTNSVPGSDLKLEALVQRVAGYYLGTLASLELDELFLLGIWVPPREPDCAGSVDIPI